MKNGVECYKDFFGYFNALKTNCVYVVALGPIKIQTCLAPQNDYQNLSFVKGAYVAGKEMTRNGRKIAKCKGCLFFKWPVFSFLRPEILVCLFKEF